MEDRALLKASNVDSKFFVGWLAKKKDLVCLKSTCRGDNIYRLSSGRLRCKNCGYTFSWSTGRLAGYFKIKPHLWISIVKQFCQGVPAIKISNNLHISNKSVLNALNMIRLFAFFKGILQSNYNDSKHVRRYINRYTYYFPQGTAYNKDIPSQTYIPVVGFSERGKNIKFIYAGLTPDRLMRLRHIKKIRHGSLIYSDQCENFDTQMFYDENILKRDCYLLKYKKKLGRGKVYVDIKSKFWIFAKKELAKYHGTSSFTFPLYLYEMKLRYEHKNNLFNLFINHITSRVPHYFDNIIKGISPIRFFEENQQHHPPGSRLS